MRPSPAISLIAPCHNSAAHLDRLLASVERQSCRDYELLLVDDCSTDDTAERILDWQARRPAMRIVPLRTERNGGPGAARNLGLENARGKYLAFVDSDDSLEPDYLRCLYEAAEKHGAGMASCGVRKLFPDGRTSLYHSLDLDSPGGLPVWRIACAFRLNLASWGSLCLREIVTRHGIRCTEGVFEDVFFNFRLLYFCRRYVAIPPLLYNYIQHPSSLTRGGHRADFSYIDGFASILNRVEDFLAEVRRREVLPPDDEKAVRRFWLRLALIKLRATAKSLPPAEYRRLLEECLEREFGRKAIYIRAFLDLTEQER